MWMEGTGRRALIAAALALTVLVPCASGVAQDTDARSAWTHSCVFDHTHLVSATTVCRPRAKSYPRYVHGRVQRAIYDSALLFGVPFKILLAIAKCESDLNPDASNGTHFGLFQFLPDTFVRGASQMRSMTGIRAHSVWNPRDASYVAGFLFAIGEAPRWSCEQPLG